MSSPRLSPAYYPKVDKKAKSIARLFSFKAGLPGWMIGEIAYRKTYILSQSFHRASRARWFCFEINLFTYLSLGIRFSKKRTAPLSKSPSPLYIRARPPDGIDGAFRKKKPPRGTKLTIRSARELSQFSLEKRARL